MSGSAADPVTLGGRSELAAGSAQRDRRIAALVSWWPLIAILLLAAALRLSTLGLQSFWYDEAFTPVHVLRSSLGSTLHNVVHTENTPPLWYLLEWGLSRVLGTGVVALRLLSALAGIATVAVAWAIGSELAGRRAAILTATLVAVNPLFVWYSQEARAYALFVFTASLALLCFLRVMRAPTNRRLAEFALTASLALLTHYFAVFLLMPMVLWLLWLAITGGWSDESAMPRARGVGIAKSDDRGGAQLTPRERTSNPKNLPRVLCTLVLPGLVGLALIPLILSQGGHGTQWIGEWALASRLEAIPQYYLSGYSGSSLGHGIEALVALLILAGVLYGLWSTLTRREERGALIALTITAAGVLTPVLLALLGADYLAPRNLVAAMVPLSALLAIVIAAQRTGRIGMALAGLLALTFLVLSVDVNLSPRLQRGDWSGVAGVLRSAQPKHVITTVELGSAPLEYYLPRLSNLHAGQSVSVTEIDETGYAPLRPGAERAPARGFHLAERRDINGLIVYRFISSVPVTLSQRALLHAVIAEEGRPEAARAHSIVRENSLASLAMSSQIAQTVSEAQVTLELACRRLLSLQDEAGWWRGELQTNVTMDAEDMFLREFLGTRRAEETERSAAWIRSQQRADGTWANSHGGPGDLSTTIEAYWALRLAGEEPEADHMRAAAEFVRAHGGIERARVFTHVWLALFGLWSWDQVPALPPEIVLLPSWVALNIYDFACWARQTIVALSIVMAHRPRQALPFTLEELHGPQPWRAAEPTSARGRWLTRLDRVLRAYERRPPRLLRRIAMAHAERWIVRRQEADGSWGGIQPPWVYSLIALRLNGYALEHPLMRRGIEGLDRFMVEEEQGDGESGGLLPVSESVAPVGSRRLEACQSPVWDTALSMVALSDAGLPGEHPALVRAGEWLLGEEVGVPGDWRVRRPTLEPGGWAFEFANDNYPDIDDTAEVVLALLRLRDAPRARTGHRLFRSIDPAAELPADTKSPDQDDRRLRAAIERAVSWTKGMQSRGGAWGAFDADNTRSLVRELPFLDFGEVIDAPSADVTAHAVEMLAALGCAGDSETVAAVRWLIERQEPCGSWFGRWGVNHLYGTGAVLPALIAAGVAPSEPCIRRAVAWLGSHQNSDGGWGEDPRSYDHAEWVGRGESTASQTAWALLALHAAGERSDAVARGVQWLVDTQREDGGWDEPQYTGTGFPCDYYINYHLYRLVFPVTALGRCLSAGRR